MLIVSLLHLSQLSIFLVIFIGFEIVSKTRAKKLLRSMDHHIVKPTEIIINILREGGAASRDEGKDQIFLKCSQWKQSMNSFFKFKVKLQGALTIYCSSWKEIAMWLVKLNYFLLLQYILNWWMENIVTKCQALKQKGNKFLKQFHFQKSIEAYTEAISEAQAQPKFPNNKLSIYFANRAYSQIKCQSYGLGLKDAQQSVSLNPQYEKGFLRLGFLNQLLGHYKDSYSAYKRAFELSGNKDTDTYQKLINVKKNHEEYIKQKKMEMFHDDKQRGSVKQKPYKSWKQVQVQANYNGPTLKEDGQVTQQWVLKLMDCYKDQKSLHKRFTLQLIQKCKNILMNYDSLINYQVNDQQQITVCGDIHGQYYDLLNIFKLNGHPGERNKYLFNGDFVDRGSFSVQCIMTLIAWKCVNKDFLHMTRGNHEAKQVNMIYGFKGEVQAKFKDIGVYEAFSELFCCLPLAYVFNKKVMVCHGGLPSQDGVTLKQLQNIERFIQPPEKGHMCDLLWADPILGFGRKPSKRGVSMGFGQDVSHKFLDENKLQLLIRSHEVKNEGYQETHKGRVITIFSAPNYCDFTGNKAAFIRLKGSQMKPKYTQFQAVPHPNIGPMAYASQFKGMF